jgi:Holliday junction resolvasome RuvABC endonuclease subunit
LRGLERLFYIKRRLFSLMQEVSPRVIVFEDYVRGFRASTGRLTDLGEVGGILKLLAYESGADVVVVPGPSLKSIISQRTKGKSDKNDIQHALKNVYGYDVSQPDEADALGLMLIGEKLCGSTELKLDAKRTASLSKCVRTKGQVKLRS